jgi:uncharacterized protein
MMAVVAILIGLTTGVISGLIGLGGGVFIVPALVYVFKMSQHEAQGTSLATLLLPIGLFGFLEYYRQGHVDLRVAALLAVGFAVGVFAGGRWRRRFQTSCCAVYSRSPSSWSRRACGLSVE